MRVGWQPAGNFIFGCGDEEVHGILLVARLGVFVKTIETRRRLIDEWTKVQVSASIHKMDACWRDVGEIAILLGGLIGRDESCQQYRQVQGQKKDCSGDEFSIAVLFSGYHACS